jgi:hypothetical protein
LSSANSPDLNLDPEGIQKLHPKLPGSIGELVKIIEEPLESGSQMLRTSRMPVRREVAAKKSLQSASESYAGLE